MDTIIRETLRPFGITRNYRGYPQTVKAIALVIEDESRLLHVTAEVYETGRGKTNSMQSFQCRTEYQDNYHLRLAHKPFPAD